ncbi:transporter [Dyella sp. ASV21]|uniref:transporter n=1 Tax=Dyella sp. ASV21 TaxID=2795114 RepID=UPI0018EA8545
MRRLFLWLTWICCAGGTVHATTVPLPGVNLGATSFEDGGGGVGSMMQWSASRFHATRNYDADGQRLSTPYDKTLWVHRLHYAYTTPHVWLGGNVGVEAVVPLVDLDLRIGATHGQARGVGNPSVGAYLQWRDRELFGWPFSSRLSLPVVLPLGRYRADARLNTGSDYFSFSPYYAWTLRPSRRWEVSGRFMYLWNGISHDPEARYAAMAGEPVNSVQAGQAAHYNLSASYAVTPEWRVGAGVYQFWQIGADRINGRSQPHSEERVYGAGPGVQWRRKQHRFVGNIYAEGWARNHSAGNHLVLRYLFVY